MVVDVGTVLAQWQSAGVFDYLLPFLLIFAVIFGILSATHILGGNRGIQIIIAIVIGLMSLQFRFVPELFREIFPRLGVGLAVIVALLILVGLFITKEDMSKWRGYVLMGVGVIVFIIVIGKSFEQYGFYFGSFGGDFAGWIILGVLFLAIIIAVAVSGGESKDDRKSFKFAQFRGAD